MEEIKEEVKTGESVEVQGASEMQAEDTCCAKKSFCKLDKKQRIIAGAILIVLIAIGAGSFFYIKKMKKTDVGPQAVRAKIEKLLEDSKGAATVGDVALDGDLYKVTVNAGGKDQSVYVTMDGTRLIQDVITFDEINKQKEAASAGQDKAQAQAAEVPKSDKPTVDLFVMSYCPYGTQMEKGILPVVSTLGSKINYNLRFVDYVMHGDKEIAENLRQYCISKNQPAKLSAYLTCFLKKGEGTADSCLASVGIAKAGVDSCAAQVDAKFSVTKNAADKATWSNGQFPTFNVDKELNDKYAVQGSPTLVVNGVATETAGRDSASILKTICGAFKDAPKECSTKLSDVSPAPGFGEGAAAEGSADASCGN